MKYHYVDAFGLKITSMIPLSCPTFIGDPNGAILEAKQRGRRVIFFFACHFGCIGKVNTGQLGIRGDSPKD